MHNTGNDPEKYPMKPAHPDPLETSLNRSLTHPSPPTSPAKILPNEDLTYSLKLSSV